jgi:ABC-type branched-subunit amino acid transport system substrate-binding protein
MSIHRSVRSFALVVVLSMLAVACGQKEGVHSVGFASGGGAGGGGQVAGGAVVADADGDGFDDATGAALADADGDGFDDATGAALEGTTGDFGADFGADTLTDGTSAAGPDTGVSEDLAGGATSADPAADSTGADPAAGGASAPAPSGGDTSGGGGSAPAGQPAPPASGGGGGGGGGAQPPAGGGGGGAAQPPAGGGGGGGGQQPAPAPRGDSTGVTAQTIRIGVHAPLTGAAPIPASSFQQGKDQYWGVVGAVAGRKVEVVFRDDKYNPSTATQVCNEMIQKEKVFLLVGSGGTDQIAACARTAAAQGVPYLSAGVTENPLNRLKQYFAISKSYAQQAPLLVQWIAKNRKPSNGVIGVIRSDTPNFDDGINAFKQAAQQAGFQVKEQKLSKDPSSTELATAAQFLTQNQIEVAYPLMAPSDWIGIAKQPAARNTKWAGVGITMGLNQVAGVACPEIDGAMFFSPWPGLNLAKQVDQRFPGGDDIVWGLWGLNKTIHQAFKKMGDNLTREAFIAAMEGPIKSGVYPDLANTAQNHFGAQQVHVLNADCGPKQFVSGRDDLFKTGF